MAEPGPELSSLSIFGALKDDALAHIESLLVRRDYPAGAELLAEGTEAHGLFVIIEGTVDVHVRIDGEPRTIARLGSGAVLGEMAIIDIMPRSATVVAASPVSTLFLSRHGFFSLCRDAPSTFAMVSLNLARELSRRLRCANVLLAENGLVHLDDTWLRATGDGGAASCG